MVRENNAVDFSCSQARWRSKEDVHFIKRLFPLVDYSVSVQIFTAFANRPRGGLHLIITRVTQ